MKEELTQEGMGLSVAQAIDKTKPPIGRPSVRRESQHCSQDERDYEVHREEQERKFSGKASISERTLTKGENTEKERLVKGMKKSYKDFKARYGEDAKSVMYATATKMAKEETEIDEATYPSDFRNPDGSKESHLLRRSMEDPNSMTRRLTSMVAERLLTRVLHKHVLM